MTRLQNSDSGGRTVGRRGFPKMMAAGAAASAAAFRPPWRLVIFPGLAITAAIMAANLFGDAFRDFLDPRLWRRID